MADPHFSRYRAIPTAKPILSADSIRKVQKIVRRVPIADPVVHYAMRLVRQTRLDGPEAEPPPDFVREFVAWGAGPRACQCLVLAAKGRALLAGRFHVSIEDIRWAWENYFVSVDEYSQLPGRQSPDTGA